MKLTAQEFLVVSHHHGELGPDSRDHPHALGIFASVTGHLDPSTGRGYDVQRLREDLGQAVATLHDKNLHDVPGLSPTFESLALLIRERLLLNHPTVVVRVVGDEYEVEV